MRNDIFTKEFIHELGFMTVSYDGQYGRAENLPPVKGKRQLQWNEEGSYIDYFGNSLLPNVFLRIYEDAGTRTVFYGVVYSQDDVRFILSRVQ